MNDLNGPITIERDGDQWCATGPGFMNQMESPIGFGETPEQAVARLRSAVQTGKPFGQMGIQRWIREGNDGLSSCAQTIGELLEYAGGCLDRACSYDIVGEVVFEAEDGVTYVGTVEFVIGRANPDYVKELIEEDE